MTALLRPVRLRVRPSEPAVLATARAHQPALPPLEPLAALDAPQPRRRGSPRLVVRLNRLRVSSPPRPPQRAPVRRAAGAALPRPANPATLRQPGATAVTGFLHVLLGVSRGRLPGWDGLFPCHGPTPAPWGAQIRSCCNRTLERPTEFVHPTAGRRAKRPGRCHAQSAGDAPRGRAEWPPRTGSGAPL